MRTRIYSGTISGPYNDPERINQDSSAYLQEDGYTVMAVADGAGSLKLSHIGSRLAANAAVKVAMQQMKEGYEVEEALNDAVREAKTVLVESEDVEQIGCTLVIAIIADKEWGVAIVGDSYAVASYKDYHDLLERPQDSEFINQTKLLTSYNHDPLFIIDDSDITALTISTDGLYHSSTHKNEASHNFWTPLIKMAEEDNLNVNDFLSFMDIKGKIDDDTTVVIAVKDNGPSGE